jgi:hypothetical protein
MLALAFCVGGLANSTSKLKGTIYDANGSVVVKAKVTAVDSAGKKFVTLSNEDGEYELILPFNKYVPSARYLGEAKYDIFYRVSGLQKIRDQEVRIHSKSFRKNAPGRRAGSWNHRIFHSEIANSY